ncbi:MAG: MFS transporter [Brevinematales bacterium]|nr:MFS transporter [Brevinematales bacterium]
MNSSAQPSFLSRKKKLSASLRASILDGCFYTMMVGFGESFFGAYVVALKASHFVIGLVGSLPQAMGSLSQLLSIQIVRWFQSRKKMVTSLVLIQAFLYFPITAGMMLPPPYGMVLIVLSITLYFMLGMVVVPAWIDWMGFLVPSTLRGRYYGLRNSITGFFSLFSFLVAGFFLQMMDKSHLVWWGYGILFFLAFVSRIFSFYFLTRVEDVSVPIPIPLLSGTNVGSALKKLPQSPFYPFLMQSVLMNMAVYLSGPYFTPYMLEELHFSYWTFTYILAIPMLVKALAMPIWGKLCDLYGNRNVLAFSATFLGTLPILWTVSSSVSFLMFVQVLSGFLWAAYDLSSFNTLYDLTSEKSRMRLSIILNSINALAYLAGALLGDRILSLAQSLHLSFSPYYLVFLTSGFLRFVVAFLWIPKIPHVSGKHHIRFRTLLWMFSVLSVRGFSWNLLQTRKKTIKKPDAPHKK